MDTRIRLKDTGNAGPIMLLLALCSHLSHISKGFVCFVINLNLLPIHKIKFVLRICAKECDGSISTGHQIPLSLWVPAGVSREAVWASEYSERQAGVVRVTPVGSRQDEVASFQSDCC